MPGRFVPEELARTAKWGKKRPTALFASASKDEKKSAPGAGKRRRPLETLTPLAARLKPKGIEINLSFRKGQEVDLAARSPP